ncbi:MAG: choice-of-anchor Q domain-containing protein [Gemmataceae bacterium]
MKDLQSALAAAAPGDEIWVAAGTYKATSGTDRSATFDLKSDVALYGGFAGTETARGQRDWARHVTTLSGDVGTPGDASDNSYHVLRAEGQTGAVVDGFTVTGGYANLPGTAEALGGGFYNAHGSSTVRHVIFQGNYAYHGGGGVGNNTGTLALADCVIAGNRGGYGGGLWVDFSSTTTATNVTIAGNTSDWGYGGALVATGSTLALTNGIVWGNTGQQIANWSGGASATYTIVQGGWAGTGNLSSDPLFADPATGDYRLRPGSPAIDAGSNAAASDTDLAGTPRPLDGDGNGSAVADVGAYEYVPTLVTTLDDSLADDGQTSLREAVAYANLHPGPDVITFAPGLTGTIRLSNAPGYGQLELQSDTTIIGPAAGVLAVSGGDATRIFQVDAGATVSISGLTIRDGTAVSGGGILALGTLTVSDTTLCSNTAVIQGGGIFADAGSRVTLADSTFSANSARSGGALMSFGSVVNVTAATFGGNTAYQGGAVYVSNSTASFGNCSLAGNQVVGTEGFAVGGAICSVSSTLTLTNSTLAENASTDLGGALYSQGDADVRDTSFSTNTSREGGGIYVWSGNLTLAGGSLAGNTASQNGGGIYNTGVLTVRGTALTGNSAGGNGGGIALHNGTAAVAVSTLSSNAAVSGAALYAEGGSTLTVTGSTLAGNAASSQGGGFYGVGTIDLTDSTFTANTALEGGGVLNGGTMTVTNCTISGNSAAYTAGGFYAGGPYSGVVTMQDTIVAGNTAGWYAPDVRNLSLSFTSLGHNLFGTTVPWYAPTALTDVISDQPLLAPLADNGGLTQTMALLPGSPAIDAGDPATMTADQRGIGPIGVRDIGAFESRGFGISIVSGSSQTTPVDTAFAQPLAVIVSSAYGEPVAGGRVDFSAPDSGASAGLAGNPAAIAPDGMAGVSATANGLMGSYSVAATAGGAVGLASFSLNNTEAAGLVVTTVADIVNPFDGETSLREAVTHANARPGADTITFGVTGTVTVSGDNFVVSDELTLSGPGAEELTIQGNRFFRLFTIAAGATATITQLTLTGSNSQSAYGGSIENLGTLFVDRCVVTDTWGNFGGAIYNAGYLTVRDTTLSRNWASVGGAVYNEGTATFTNVTVAENYTPNYGGGICNFGTLTLQSSTIAENSAAYGGGIRNTGTATLGNTLIANNHVTWVSPDVYGGVISLGHNLIGSDEWSGGWVSSDLVNVDPLLAALGTYGGLTQTMALLPGSPAIDAGDPAFVPPPSTDQRGMPRVSAGRIDIGAYEAQQFVWTGSVSADWGDAANWDQHAVPTAMDLATIPDTANDPVLGNDRAVGALTILAGARLSLAGNDLSVVGPFVNQGTLTLQGTESVSLTQDATQGTWEYVGDGTGAPLNVIDFGPGTDYFNLVINDAHASADTFRLAADLAVAGNFGLGGGTFAASGWGTNVVGLATITGGNYQAGAGTQTFAGNLTMDGGRLTLGSGGTVDTGDLTMLNSSQLIGMGGIIRSDDVSIGWPSLAIRPAVWYVSGNFLSSPGSWNPADTMVFNGTGTQSSNIWSYNGLVHSGPGTLRMVYANAPVSIYGSLVNEVGAGAIDTDNLTVTVTGLADIRGGAYLAGSGTQNFNGGLTVSGGTFTGSTGAVNASNVTLSAGLLTAPTAALSVSGNWSKTGGVFDANGGSVVFASAGTQTLESGGNAFRDVGHDGAGTLQLQDSLTATGSLTNTHGTFDVNGFNATVGSLSGSGNVALGNDGHLTVGSDNSDAAFSGSITAAPYYTGWVIKTGTGTWTRTGSGNSYGVTQLLDGTLAVASDAALPGQLFLNGGTLKAVGGPRTLGNPYSVYGTTVLAGDQDLTLTYAGYVGGGATLVVRNTATTTLPSWIYGSGSFAVDCGPGTVRMTGRLDPAGSASVASGTLEVDGPLGMPLTVGPAGVLTGTGELTQAAIVSGTLSPGVAGPGVMQAGTLTLVAGAHFLVDFAPGSADQVTAVDGVNLADAALDVVAAGHVPVAGEHFTLISNDGTDAVWGTFAGLDEGAVVSTDFLGSGLVARITYRGGDGNDVVLVVNSPPVITGTGGPYSLSEGQSLHLSATASDPDGDPVSYAWAVNGVAVAASGQAATLTWADLVALGVADGPAGIPVVLTVTDGVSAPVSVGTSLAVANTPPTVVSFAGPTLGVRGQARDFSVVATDPSPSDQAAGFTYSIDWGDGTEVVFGAATATLTHTYTTPGTDTPRLTATDKDGGVSASAAAAPITVGIVQVQGDTLAVGGVAGNDSLVLSATTTPGDLKVTFDGAAYGTFHPTGGVLVFGAGGHDAATLNGNGTGNQYVIAPTAVVFNGLPIATDGAVTWQLNGMAGPDTFVLAGGSASISGGTGSDTLVGPDSANVWALVGDGTGTLNGIFFTGIENLTGGSADDTFHFSGTGSVTGSIRGGAGVNTLDYLAYATPISVNLATAKATGTGGIADFNSLQGSLDPADKLTAGNGANVWTVSAADAGDLNGFRFAGVANLVGGTGADTFAFTADGRVSGSISGGAGNVPNTLDVSRSAEAVTVNLAAKTAAPVVGTAWSAFTSFVGDGRTSTLVGGDGTSVWALTGQGKGAVGPYGFEAFANLTGGSGTDTFKLGADGEGVAGTLDGGGGKNYLTGGANAGATWTVTGPNSGSISGAGRFVNVQTLTGGGGDDVFAFIDGGGVTGAVAGGAGSNAIDLSGWGAGSVLNLQTKKASGIGTTWSAITAFSGDDATSTLVGPNAVTTWNVNATNAGTAGAYVFGGFANLTGGTAADTFVLADAADVTGAIDGGTGAGVNTLDYSAYSTGVKVDLKLLSATNTAAIANIQNVNGGAGDDLLVGDDAANRLVGNGGYNVLIGGKGADTLTGGSGSDLLIAGYTAYDSNLDALDSFLSRWADHTAGYQARVTAVLDPTYTYNLTAGTTVFDDAAADKLTGGADLDLFFAHSSGTGKDTMDFGSGEVAIFT